MTIHRTHDSVSLLKAAMTSTWVRSIVLALAITSVAACGDDGDTAEPSSTTGGPAAGDLGAFCAAAEEIAANEGFPSATQATAYAELAPTEIHDAAETTTAPFVANEGDDVALFAAMADDDVEDAFRVVNAFETEQCGIDNSEVTNEDVAVDNDANRVDVRATEYDFKLPDTLSAGPTSLVLTNDGQEAHFMLIYQIEPGHTVQEALEFEGDPEEAGLITDLGLESGFAAPDGEDIEVLNADLEAGDYALVCFLPGPDGTPHAFMGMATPFTVA